MALKPLPRVAAALFAHTVFPASHKTRAVAWVCTDTEIAADALTPHWEAMASAAFVPGAPMSAGSAVEMKLESAAT